MTAAIIVSRCINCTKLNTLCVQKHLEFTPTVTRPHSAGTSIVQVGEQGKSTLCNQTFSLLLIIVLSL